MRGVSNELPLTLQIFHKGADCLFRENEQENEYDQCAGRGGQNRHTEHVIGGLNL